MDAEIKDPSVENPELRGSPIKAWSGSEYRHAFFSPAAWDSPLLISRFIYFLSFFFSKTSPEFFLC